MRLLLRRREGDYTEHLLESALAEPKLAPADRHLCHELVYGIVRREATIDWLIARKTAGRTQKPMLQNLLRLGLYQIFWLDRIPPHAAVNETVALARQLGFGSQAGFINAVLRGYLREVDAARGLLEELKVTQPHLGYSHPEWLTNRWRARWGDEQAGRLMQWNNTPPKTFARVNGLKIDAGQLLTLWREEGVDYDFVRRDWLPESVVFELKSHPPVHRLRSFERGLFYIQDPSTLLAVKELAPQPGETVLDLCAAPGGKLSYAVELMRNQGQVSAHDLSPERLQQVKENCARLGLTSVKAMLPGELSPTARFDRVLVDAPCSNTGVMRRRVDLRWRVRLEEIERLRRTQLELLMQAASHLKEGGVLVYSTCSLEPEENASVVQEFLARNVWFRLERAREILPFVDQADGAYVARLVRT